ncbi:MAG: hypothetical protein ACJAQT_000266 [Akkermansiaceae bacterium]|jgi:hypothetical protein
MKYQYLLPLLLVCTSCDENKSQTEDHDTNQDVTSSSPITESSSKREVTRSTRKLQTERANIASAETALTQLVFACEDYYEAYQQLPLGSISDTDSSHTTITPLSSEEPGSFLMAALLGMKSAKDENYKLISFFTFKVAKDKKDGLSRFVNGAELFDPWGNPYHLFLNYDYDNELRLPLDKQLYFDTKVLAWSPGPDGQSGTPETNKDNITSWQK